MDYTTLVADKDTEGSIKYLVNYAAVPSELILTNAQALIFSFLRVREMRLRDTDSFSEGDTSDGLPARCLEVNSVQLTGDNQQRLTILPPDDFEDTLNYEADSDPPTLEEGTPSRCTITGTQLLIDVTADDTYNYSIWYYGYPEPLSTTSPTNFLTDRYPHILTAGVRHYAFDYRQHKDLAADELQKLMGYIQRANVEADYQTAAYTFQHHWERP